MIFTGESAEYFANLKDLVEETYTLNNNTKVLFVVHSMGGPMTLHFLQMQSQSWKDKYVQGMVSLSGAFAGSVKTLKVFVMGMNLLNVHVVLLLLPMLVIIIQNQLIKAFGCFFLICSVFFFSGDNLGVYVLSQSILKEMQITSPSLAWLMPNKVVWKDDLLVSTPDKNYTLANIKDFFE